MRQGQAGVERQAIFGPYVLAPERRLLTRQGAPVAVGARALEVLIALVSENGRVLTHRQLVERAWAGLTVEESNLRVAVSGLRKTLGEGENGARYIENVVGRGYCFVAPVRWLEFEADEVAPSPAPVKLRQSTRLPLPAARVIGRESVVDKLAAAMGDRALITLVGAGGLGKTTVAALVAQTLKARSGLETVFVDLSAATDEAALTKAVAVALGLDGPGRELVEAIVACLATHRLLLVLDGCEHVVEAAAAFCDRLTRSLDAYLVLATSREALRVEAETIHLLEPLAFPSAEEDPALEGLLAYSAVQLFIERAQVSGRRGPWTPAEARLAGDICRRLDGVALAIELVASRVGALGLTGVADLLDDTLGLQWPGRRDAAPRHQTLQALLDWSHDLLGERDRRVLRRLCLFTGPFTLRDAHAVAGEPGDDTLDVANALTSLVDKSLVWTSHGGAGPVQFRLLDTTRAYALAKLGRSQETDMVAERHAAQVLARLTADGVGQGASLFRTNAPSAPPAVGDVLAALRWAQVARPREMFAGLAVAAAPLLLSRAMLDECEAWCARALTALPDERRGGLEELRLLEAVAIARMFGRGNHETVREIIDRGLALAQGLGATVDQVHLLAGQHIFLTRIGDFSAALECGRQCARLCDPVRDPGGAALAQWMLGTSMHLIADQRLAQEAVERGFAYWATADADGADFFGYDHKVRAMIVLCRVLWLRGERVRSAEVGEAALAEAERGGRPVSLCIALIYTATVALWDENWDAAERLVARLIEHAARHGIGPYHGVGLALAGELDIGRERYAQGVETLGRALERLDREAHRILSPALSGTFAKGLHAMGERAKARRRVLAALEEARAIGEHYDLPRLCLIASEIFAEDDPQAGRTYALQALEAARAQSALGLELAAAIALFACEAEGGERAKARQRLEQILTLMPDHDGPMARRGQALLSAAV